MSHFEFSKIAYEAVAMNRYETNKNIICGISLGSSVKLAARAQRHEVAVSCRGNVLQAPSSRRSRNSHATPRAIQIPSRRERREKLNDSQKPLLWGVVDRFSRANEESPREMADDEEADCSNNARLFRMAVSNCLKKIAESVRWVTFAQLRDARVFLSVSRATSRA